MKDTQTRAHSLGSRTYEAFTYEHTVSDTIAAFLLPLRRILLSSIVYLLQTLILLNQPCVPIQRLSISKPPTVSLLLPNRSSTLGLGSEPIYSCVVQAGTLEVVGCILQAWLAGSVHYGL